MTATLEVVDPFKAAAPKGWADTEEHAAPFTSDEVVAGSGTVFLPERFPCGTLFDASFRVTRAFTVRVSRLDDGGFMAEAPDFGEYGYGEDSRDALRDLAATIRELYLTLNDEADRLGSDLARVLQSLRERIAFKKPR